MSRNVTKYKHWLISKINTDSTISPERYSNLLNYMFETNFFYFDDIPAICMDKNRASDGIYMRVYFEEETGLVPEMSNRANILEVFVALSMRIEQDIMGEGDNNYGKWFNIMISNLGLSGYDDDHWNKEKISVIFERFMYRRYVREGEGSLFPLKNYSICSDNYEKIEIWNQLQYYLNENFG